MKVRGGISRWEKVEGAEDLETVWIKQMTKPGACCIRSLATSGSIAFRGRGLEDFVPKLCRD